MAVGIVLTAFAANGYEEGLLQQVSGMVGMLLGSWLASRLCVPLATQLSSSPQVLPVLQSLTCIGIIFAMWLLAKLGGRTVRQRWVESFSRQDRFAGALLGLSVGTLVISVSATTLRALGIPLGETIWASRLGGACGWLGQMILGALPSAC